MAILSATAKFKLQIISMFLAIFAGIIFIVLIFITSTQNQENASPAFISPIPTPNKNYIDDPSDGFIVPQGKNPESPNNGFSAQITGTFVSAAQNQLTVKVNRNQTKIILPSQVQYYCLPQNYTDKYGNPLDLSQAFVDVRELEKTSPFLSSSEIIKNFKTDDQINIKVTYNQKSEAVADFILDYSCEN